MPTPGTISACQLAKLSGLSERQLRRHADDGWLPRPVKNEYLLVPAIQGILRYYRDRERTSELLDEYDCFSACEAATGIPMLALRRAKRRRCSAVRDGKVRLTPFLRWWYATSQPHVVSFELERAAQVLLQNEKLRVIIRRMRRELVAASEVSHLGAELGAAIRKVVTRLHRIAPSLEGQTAENIRKRLQEEEADISPQLRIVDDRVSSWRQAE
jgi:hypothetical protein